VVREVGAETGVLTSKTRRVRDSTVLDDPVVTQYTVTQLVAAIRRVGRLVPDAAAVIGDRCTRMTTPIRGNRDRVGRRPGPGRPGRCPGGGRPPGAGRAPRGRTEDEALALLALVAGQDVEWVPDVDTPSGGAWAIAQWVALDRVISVHDPDARHAHKTTSRTRSRWYVGRARARSSSPP